MIYITFNLEWYRIFLHTARAGNLTRAAQELHITQPSVSYAIKQMEEELGVKLFHRLSKGVKLTTEGEALFTYVQQSFSLLYAGEETLQNLKALTDGELRIGASDSLIKSLLLPYLDTFHSRYPKIRIRLSHGKTTDIVHRLKEGLIDFGIVHMPIHDPSLDIHPLSTVQDTFVVGEAFRELASRPLSAEEIGGLPLLLLSPGSSSRRFVEQWFAAQGVSIEADIELGSIDLLAEFARLGFGTACVNRTFVEKALEEETLFELRPTTIIPVRGIGIATRRDMSLSLAASPFLEMLTTAFSHRVDSHEADDLLSTDSIQG